MDDYRARVVDAELPERLTSIGAVLASTSVRRSRVR
jgi:hypothetical protein